MKKLCAYLTLFVLGIICFAQPAVATDYKFYFQKPSDWVAPVGFNSWAFEGGHYKTTAAGELGVTKMTLVAGTTDIYEIDIYDATSVGNIEFFSNGDTPDWNKTYKIENNASNIKSGWLYTTSGPQSEYTPPVVGPVDPVEPEDTFDVVFYLDCSKAGWTTPYLYTYEWSDEMNGKNTLCTTKLSNGIFKFVLKDQTTVGNILFRSTASEWGDDKQTDDIRPGTNGALYTLTSQSGRWQVSTTPNYVEPVVKPVVTATPASGTSFGYNESLTVSLASSVEATIYYTTNGDEPSETSTRYTGSFVLNSSATVKAFAVTYDGTKGDVATFEYTRTTPPAVYIRAAFISTGSWGINPGTDKTLTYDADKGYYTYEVSAKDFEKGSVFMVSLVSGDKFWTDGRYESVNGGKLDLPAAKPENANLKRGGNTDLYLPAAGTICFDPAALKIWYEAAPVAPVVTATPSTNFYDNVKVVITATDGATIYYTTNGDEPTTESTVYSAPLTFTETTTLKVLAVADGLSSEVMTYTYTLVAEPTLYVFYVKIADAYKATWGDDCYLYTFNDEDADADHQWTSVAGQCVRYTERLIDGVFKFVLKGQSTNGAMLFKNTSGTGDNDWKEQSEDFRDETIVNGGLYTIKAKKGEQKTDITPDYKVETTSFEPGVTYYVDVNQCSWFKEDGATLGVRYGEKVHYGFREVAPGVYAFTVEEKLASIEVGRRTSKGFYNEVTVAAPAEGNNCFWVKNQGGDLVFDKEGKYTVSTGEAGLYIIGSFMGDDWKGAQPLAMEYDEDEDVYSFRITTNASPAHPIQFSISTSDTQASFYDQDKQFDALYQGSNYLGYVHFAEPAYNNATFGAESDRYFSLISSGTVKAKYVIDEDGVHTKVWYEPIIWPDLYILGSIIAPRDDTQPTHGSNAGTGQWNTVKKMTPVEDQPGLFYYDLGQNGNEDLFNLNPFWSRKDNADGTMNEKSINEVGHFNFSFLPTSENATNVVSDFWHDPFLPAAGGMGTLNVDGTPEPFVYRDSNTGRSDWVSTNFVFARQCRVWVDAVRQIVWVEVTREISPNEIIFDFWDKGGSVYPNDAYSWWTPSNDATWSVEIYLNDPENYVSESVVKSINWMAEEVEDGKGAGVRYHFVHNVGAAFYTDETYTTLKGNGQLCVRIRRKGNDDHDIRRPYAYQATYTQGPIDDINFNHYGEVKYKGDPIVTIEPEVSMIHADKEVIKLPGSTREDQVMHYHILNQFRTMVTVNPGQVYPFWMEGVTEPGEEEGQYVPVEGSDVVFTKSNQVTVSYGTVRETRMGSTGVGLITGVDHVNAADEDNLDVRVTYTSPGMIFDRRKVMKLNDYATLDNLPTMQNSSANNLEVYGFYGSKGTDNSLSLDLILEMPFAFRDHMIASRAAFVGYEIEIDGDRDLSLVDERNTHVAKSGRPLIWDFDGANIQKHDADLWHYESFTDRHLAVQIHRVASGKTVDEVKNSGKITGRITYHMYVPVATDFEFVTGAAATGALRARAASNILGDESNPYRGAMTAGSYDSFTKEFSFDPSKQITTGVEGVNVEDAEAEVEFFTLQGVRVSGEDLAPGVYIRRQGRTASKVYIR